nr:NAD-dependent epimerase/dehydratase family protein [uncultured Methanoregula sp.]
MKKHILITGGAGFIGSHLAKRCLHAGYDVTIVDNLSTGEPANIPQGVNFIDADISSPEWLDPLKQKPVHAVLHLAAQSSGEVSDEHPDLDLKVNTLGTLLLLKWCLENHVNHFLYASSMAVYGNVEHNPVHEDVYCYPLSFYGISKYTSEQYIRHFSKKGLNTTCFRMFSVYGPGQNMKNMKQGMVSIFLAYLMNNEPVHVKGSKERFRDFIYIDDVVDAWLLALDNPKAFGKTYNLATGRKTLVGTLVDEEILAFGLNRKTYPVKYEGNTPADQFGLYADISRIRKDLNWEPQISLPEGLKKMVSWLKQTTQSHSTKQGSDTK